MNGSDDSLGEEIAHLSEIVAALKEHGRVADDPRSVQELVARSGREHIEVSQRHIDALISLGVVARKRPRRFASVRRRARELRRPVGIGLLVMAALTVVGGAFLLLDKSTDSTITGVAFVDFDGDGLQSVAKIAGERNDEPIAGVEVTLIDATESAVERAVTDESGRFAFSPSARGPFRIEYSEIPAGLFSPAGVGPGGGSVQFVERGGRSDLPLVRPAEYCQSGPVVSTACFISGDHRARGPKGAGSADAVVSFPWEATDYEESFPPADWPPATTVPAARWTGETGPKPSSLAEIGDVGAVWGLAYDRVGDRLFTSAMLKRHADLGPLGTGGLYAIDDPLSPNASASSWLDVQTLRYPADMPGSLAGGPVRTGDDPRDGSPGNSALPQRVDQPSYDVAAFSAVGLRGFGDIDIDADGETLWAVNLFDRTLLAIDASDKELVGAWPLPNPGCPVADDARPWGLAVQGEEAVVGIVCSAQSGGRPQDLSAHVMRLVGGEFKPVLTVPLNYRRRAPASPPAESRVAAWIPWVKGTDANDSPQPILSDIEFDSQGITLALLDRQGHQWGHANYAPVLGDTTPDESRATAGELLRACEVGGVWTLEDNGRCGRAGRGTQDDGTGPSGPFRQTKGSAEFFFGEGFRSPFAEHEEASLGSVASLAGSPSVAATILDPVALLSAGTAWLDLSTGDHTHRYEVLVSEDVDAEEQNGTFGKASGLGDLEVLCRVAPLRLGGRLWLDANSDGLQGPSEESLPAGIVVTLHDKKGRRVGQAKTDDRGHYSFDWQGGAQPRGRHEVRISQDQPGLADLMPTSERSGEPSGSHGVARGDLVRIPVVVTGRGHSALHLSAGWIPEQE